MWTQQSGQSTHCHSNKRSTFLVWDLVRSHVTADRPSDKNVPQQSTASNSPQNAENAKCKAANATAMLHSFCHLHQDKSELCHLPLQEWYNALRKRLTTPTLDTHSFPQVLIYVACGSIRLASLELLPCGLRAGYHRVAVIELP